MRKKGLLVYFLSCITVGQTQILPTVNHQNSLIVSKPKKIHFNNPNKVDDTNVFMPNWLSDSLDEKVISQYGYPQYYTNIFERCFSSPQSLAICYRLRKSNLQIVHALVYGSIVLAWGKDLMDLFSGVSNLKLYDLMTQSSFVKIEPQAMIEKFIEKSWEIMQSELTFYDGISNRIGSTSDVYSNEKGYIKKADLLKRWWKSFPYYIEVAEEYLKAFEAWTEDLQDWEDYLYNLGLQPSAQDFDQSLMSRTTRLITTVKESPYFSINQEYDPNTYMPYMFKIPQILESACPAKVIRLYCSTYDCSKFPDFSSDLQSVDYVKYPELMKELTHIITSDNRWNEDSRFNSIEEEEQKQKDESRFSTKLPEVCLQSGFTLKFCDICGVFQHTIYFYLSQALILYEYSEDLPYLYNFAPPTEFSVNQFNFYLISLYKDIRPLFNMDIDVYLAFWENKPWSGDIVELYQVYRGYNELWELKPPTKLMQENHMVIHGEHFALKDYTLQFYWRRLLDTIKRNRNEWWKEIMLLAANHDIWLKKYKVKPFLEERCSKLTLLSAFELLRTQAEEIPIVSKGDVTLPQHIQLQLAQFSGSRKGSLRALKNAFILCKGPWYKKKKKDVSIPLLPISEIPDKEALLRNDYTVVWNKDEKLQRQSTYLRRRKRSNIGRQHSQNQQSFMSNTSSEEDSVSKKNNIGEKIRKKASKKFLKN